MMTARIPLPGGAAEQSADLVVVHAMAEFLDLATDDQFAVEFLRGVGLSAHAFVTPSGVVIRSRSDDQGAWHAKGFNTDSLGVEFLVPGLHTYATFTAAIRVPYLTDAQYAAGVALVQGWIESHELDRIARHSDLSPGRKVDPGQGFPWDQFLDDVGWKES